MTMVKVHDDALTKAVQKDVHEMMEREGVENFFECLGKILGKKEKDTATVRKRMMKGDWLAWELIMVSKKTNGKNVAHALRKEIKEV